MTYVEVEYHVRSIISEHTNLPPEQIKVTDTLASLRLDSLEVVKINMECEEFFNINIPDSVVAKFVFILDIVIFIASIVVP